jgi:hypothetical protein
MAEATPKTLRAVLLDHSGLTAPLGEAPQADRERLERDLTRLDGYLQSHYRTMLVLLVALFLVGIAVVLFFINDAKQASAVVAAIGLGAGGAVKKLGEIGRETANIRLVIALASSLDSDQLALVVQALARKLPA